MGNPNYMKGSWKALGNERQELAEFLFARVEHNYLHQVLVPLVRHFPDHEHVLDELEKARSQVADE